MVRGGNAHFFTYTQEYDRGRQEKTNRRTNTNNKLGVNQEQRKVCNTTCMCIPDSRHGLTLAWVTSENSTMLLESDILRLFFTGPYLVSSPLCSVSGVDCPSALPRQLLCSPLSCPVSTALRGLQPQLPLLLSSHQLLSWVASSTLLSRPRSTSGYGEIFFCPRILCLVSRQNRLVCFGGLPP